jgi:hypothetical protein
MGGNVEAIADAARDAAASAAPVDAATRSLSAHPRWAVDAAYAYVRRREQEEQWRRGADLLEVAIARRKRHAYEGPRRWQRVEYFLAVQLSAAVGYVALALTSADWLNIPVALLWLATPASQVWAIRRAGVDLPAVDAEAAGTISSRASSVVWTARDLDEAAVSSDEAVLRLRDVAHGFGDELDRELAALALAEAERRLAAAVARGRKRRLGLVGLARGAHLQTLSGTTRRR